MNNSVSGDAKENLVDDLFSDEMEITDVEDMLSGDDSFADSIFNQADDSTFNTEFDSEYEVDPNIFADPDLEELEAGIDGVEYGFGDNPLADLFDDDVEDDLPDIGFSWVTIFWAMLLVGAIAAFLLNAYRLSEESSARSAALNTTLQIQSDVKDISHQSVLALDGSEVAFARLRDLRAKVDSNLQKLEFGDSAEVGYILPELSENNFQDIKSNWSNLGPEVDVVIANRDALSNTLEQVRVVNDLTPQLLDQTDQLVDRLIASDVDLKLVNIAARQRFLSQRIKASANEFATGSIGWRDAVQLFQDDISLFGRVNQDIRVMGDYPIGAELSRVDAFYNELNDSAEIILGNVDSYAQIQDATADITDLSTQAEANISGLLSSLRGDVAKARWVELLPLIFAGIGLLGVIGMIWSLIRQNARREKVNALRTKRAEDSVIKLLDEMGDLAQGDLTVEARVTNEVTGAIADSVNFAIGEMRELVRGIKSASNEMTNATEDSEELIAQLLTSNEAQSEEILNAAQEVEAMTSTMSRMSQSTLQSSDRAKVTAESAKQGAAAVRDTIVGMNATRHHIQDTAKRLKRLGESSQQINEIVNLIQDVTEQTNVLSLNASIQAAMAGEAGRGFAVVAEEVQRLADRSARASSEITELVKNIQQDANNAIASMETTTEEVITGAKLADQAGQSLDEIEQISQDLFEVIESVSTEANQEAIVAQTVSERMDTLKSSTEQSDLSVSQVAMALGEIRDVVGKLDKSVAGFRLPN